jgi:anti-sigma factor RsiW
MASVVRSNDHTLMVLWFINHESMLGGRIVNYHPSHIPISRLVDWVEERLPAEEYAQLEMHIAGCTRCRQEAARLQRMIELMRSDTTVDPPSQVISRALNIFRPRTAPATPPLLQRLRLVLHFTNAQLSPAFGVRSTTSTSRQVWFNVGEYDLDLRITPDEDAWVISGQVLGGVNTDGYVELQGSKGVGRAQVNEPGEFVLPPMPAGGYKLVVQLADCEIEIYGFELGI